MKLQEIAQITDKASPGPWPFPLNVGFGCLVPNEIIGERTEHHDYIKTENATFIYHARNLMPLLTEVARCAHMYLSASAAANWWEKDELKAALQKIEDYNGT